jgi:hypothetical protein
VKRLYKIWKVVQGTWKPPVPSYIVVDQEHKTYAYPLTQILDVVHYAREDVISTDLAKLQEFCTYLNEMADEDEHYDIREEKYEPV